MVTEKGVLLDAFFVSGPRCTRLIILLIKLWRCAIQFRTLQGWGIQIVTQNIL